MAAREGPYKDGLSTVCMMMMARFLNNKMYKLVSGHNYNILSHAY